MRHKPIEITSAGSGRLKSLRNDIGHHADGMAENFPPSHSQMSGRSRRGRPSIDIELVAVTAIRAQWRGQDAPILRGSVSWLCFEYHGPRSVAEKHAGPSVRPVKKPRECLRADHQGTPVR